MTHLWGLLWRLLVSALIAVIVLLAMLLLAACTVSDSGKGEEDGGSSAMDSDMDTILLHAQTLDGYLRSQPALVWSKPQVTRLVGRQQAPGRLLSDSEWVDPLTTHRIFIGRNGPVYISRDIAPDSNFWAGVGVAGCESEWRAAVDSPTGDTGFWQLNRIHEWRFLRRGWTWEDAKDAEKNTEIAYEIFLEQNWQPWTTRDCVGRSLGTSGDY